MHTIGNTDTHADQNGFPHSGTVTVGGKLLSWRERAGGEIIFSRSAGAEMEFADLKLDAPGRLTLINQLLAHYRPHAIPDQNGYYAASAGITRNGKLFVAVNNEQYIKEPFAGRGCGESAMLRKSQEALGDKGIEFSEVYLMSGAAEKKPDGSLRDKQPGHVACLCGECRANLRSHTRDGKFIMLPANNGSAELTINNTASATSHLRRGEAWEISHAQMYPLPPHRALSPGSNAVIRDGYRYITDTGVAALPAVTSFAGPSDSAAPDGNITISVADFLKLRKAYAHQDFSLSALNDNPSLENINRVMLQFMKKAYAAHADKISDDKNIEISIILLKTNKGEFFPGVLVEGELWLPSKPPEIPAALSNAYNQIGIVEVYMMTFNDRQIRGELSAWNSGSKEGHGLKMPGSAALGRLIKNLKDSDQPVMKILPVNDGKLSEAELKDMQIEINVRDAFGPGYANPKRTNGHTH